MSAFPAHWSVNTLQNPSLTVTYLTRGAMRIVGLSTPAAPDNWLAVLPTTAWDTPYGPFQAYGGHRFWHAPEAHPRTYVPDAPEMDITPLPDGVRLVQPPEAPTGLQKSLELHLDAQRPRLTVQHTLTNHNLFAVEAAPWGITQLPLGGTAVLPQGAPVTSEFTPNRTLALWPYTRWDDPRLNLHGDMLLVQAQAALPPFKVGFPNHAGWLAYLRGETLFIKRFTRQAEAAYTDLNSNAQVYVNDTFIELESQGPLTRLEPGASVQHSEVWEMHAPVDCPPTPQALRGLLAELGCPSGG